MYQGFASIYDALMHDAPYDIWAAYIDGFLGSYYANSNNMYAKPSNDSKPDTVCDENNNTAPLLILDLACGTGSIALRLAQKGYELIGVDSSEDMLAEANRKAYEQGADILFLAQDMRELNLYGTVDAVLCVCDGLNYILTEDDLRKVFARVRLFLNPGGVFIFDMNTEYKFKQWKNLAFEDTGANGEHYEWQNHYNPETRINEFHMLFFSPNESKPFEELHKQRAYSPTAVCNMLLEAGFSSVKMRNDYTNEPLTAESARAVYIVTG